MDILWRFADRKALAADLIAVRSAMLEDMFVEVYCCSVGKTGKLKFRS